MNQRITTAADLRARPLYETHPRKPTDCDACDEPQQLEHTCQDGTRPCGCPDLWETVRLRPVVRVRVECQHMENAA